MAFSLDLEVFILKASLTPDYFDFSLFLQKIMQSVADVGEKESRGQMLNSARECISRLLSAQEECSMFSPGGILRNSNVQLRRDVEGVRC